MPASDLGAKRTSLWLPVVCWGILQGAAQDDIRGTTSLVSSGVVDVAL